MISIASLWHENLKIQHAFFSTQVLNKFSRIIQSLFIDINSSDYIQHYLSAITFQHSAVENTKVQRLSG